MQAFNQMCEAGQRTRQRICTNTTLESCEIDCTVNSVDSDNECCSHGSESQCCLGMHSQTQDFKF